MIHDPETSQDNWIGSEAQMQASRSLFLVVRKREIRANWRLGRVTKFLVTTDQDLVKQSFLTESWGSEYY
ncbi:hypothetical protein TorRG33x02_153760 [Trema orientale]|uniref:Uncharacterized protein n=1 Tax=Trema orientale TaxID=63057 RepID=A0A2P5ETH6_TREOI|nr:hypothetical protein TorRG33x02_153760 [Trema orientale]